MTTRGTGLGKCYRKWLSSGPKAKLRWLPRTDPTLSACANFDSSSKEPIKEKAPPCDGDLRKQPATLCWFRMLISNTTPRSIRSCSSRLWMDEQALCMDRGFLVVRHAG